VLALLDACAQGLDVSPEALVTAFEHDPVLAGFSPDRVVQAFRRTGQADERRERKVVVAGLRRAGWATSEASLWLAAMDDELTGGCEYTGWWMSEEYEKQFRFELWRDGVVDVTLREPLASPVSSRVGRLMSAYRAIPPEQEPWNLILDHGAGLARSALKLEHERREGIGPHTADADWRLARQKLVERGECGILTPLLVALRDGPQENVDRELTRLRRFCKRNGLPPMAGKARLQGK
jgi:hypothetical protein